MIKSRGNRRLKDIRRLRRSKGRGEGLLLEGRHLIEAALEAGIPLLDVLVTPDFLAERRNGPLLDRLPLSPLTVAAPLLDELADADTPRGIVAVADHRWLDLESAEPPRGGPLLFVDRLQDPGNLGALARVAEAAGVEALCLSAGCVHPGHPRALRASAGSLLRCPALVRGSADLLAARAGERYVWAGLEPHHGEDLYRTSLDGDHLILAVGSEGGGLSEEVRNRLRKRLTIPMGGRVESLNAVVAAALTLYELRRRRGAALATDPDS